MSGEQITPGQEHVGLDMFHKSERPRKADRIESSVDRSETMSEVVGRKIKKIEMVKRIKIFKLIFLPYKENSKPRIGFEVSIFQIWCFFQFLRSGDHVGLLFQREGASVCVCVCFVSWEDREILVGNWERSMNLMNSAVFWYFKQLLSK